jgi:hypothetical protein
MSKVFTVPGEQLNRAAAGDLSTSMSDTSAVLRDPGNPANRSGFIDDQGGSTSHASALRDPENPANRSGFIGDQEGSTSHASILRDPENPASRSGFVGDQSPSSAGTDDAFLSQGEASGYATNPNRISDPVEDTSHAHALNPDATPDVEPQTPAHHDGDITI